MFDRSGDEPSATATPTGVGSAATLAATLAGSLTQLAEVTVVLASVSFAELSESTIKETLVALDGCRNRLDATSVHAVGVFDGQAM